MKIAGKLAWMALLVVVISLATAQPEIDENANAEETFDGLVEVKNSKFQRAWIDPTVDLAPYNKIMPGGATFQFRAARKMSASQARRSSASNFYISEKDQEKLKQVVDEIFNEELQKSKYFTMTDRPGPDVLIIEGALLDIASFVPPDIVGRGEIYLDRVGEATLVLELVDSMSGEVLARAAERRAAQPAGRMGIQSNPVTTWNEVRRLARRWAVKLRDGLDDFKAQSG